VARRASRRHSVEEKRRTGKGIEASSQAPIHKRIATAEVVWPMVLASLIAGLYSSSGVSSVALIFGIFAAILLSRVRNAKARAVDWAILALAGLQIPELFSSSYRANSMGAPVLMVLSVLVFFAVRHTITRLFQIALLAGALGLGGVWLGLEGLNQVAVETGRLREFGFSNLVAFRSRLIVPPTTWILGEWFTLALLALPFACALPIYLWQKGRKSLALAALLLPSLTTAVLTLSLSRAVFWSTVLFYLSAWVLMVASRVLSPRAGTAVLAGALVGLALILAFESAIYPGIIKAYTGNHTSQARSTEGRVEIWNRSMRLVRAHPLLGVGWSNSALMLLSSADEEETTGFASRTFSLPVQILVEQGIIGIFLYAVFLILVARQFIATIRRSPPMRAPEKSNKHDRPSTDPVEKMADLDANAGATHKLMVCCFAAGLIAVLSRELTYSSLTEHSLTMVLTATLAALVCQSAERQSYL
jgi:O-antigen ligase